jgi:hypothetical protein
VVLIPPLSYSLPQRDLRYSGVLSGKHTPAGWGVWRETMAAMEQTPLPRPNRRQARRLVVSLMLFWALWGTLTIGLMTSPPHGAIAGLAAVIAVAAGWTFFYTISDVWKERIGESALLSAMLLLSFAPFRLRWQATTALFRPSWIRATLRATEWPVALLALVLIALGALDVALGVWIFTHAAPSAAPRSG